MSNSALKKLVEKDVEPRHEGDNLDVSLCVDLDGTLIKTDSLVEGVLNVLKRHPEKIPLLFLWLLKGKPYFKRKIAKEFPLDVKSLPYDDLVLNYISAEKAKGRKVYLVTGANNQIAKSICEYLKIFRGYYASTNNVNLVGRNKALLLNSVFKDKGFEYIGNSNKDISVWKFSKKVIASNISKSTEKRIIKRFHKPLILSVRQPLDKSAVKKVLRPHQWAKNFLVFLPMILGNDFTWQGTLNGVIAFISFSIAASAGYVFNDLLDINSDRKHEQKRFRPIASGRLAIEHAFLIIPVLVAISLLVGYFVSIPFSLLVLGYFLLSAAYTIKLKKLEIVDVIVLSLFYTIRIYVGGVATHTFPSVWLFGFSSFFFLSLAMIKRSTELVSKIKSGSDGSDIKTSRGYELRDHNQLSILGTVSGFVSILVLGLYINSEKVMELYRHPEALWVLCLFLTYWISRFWILTSRGQMSHDPVLFALKDKASYVVGAILFISWIIARGF